MKKCRVASPYIAGLVAGLGVIIWMVIDAVVRQANLLVIPIILGVGVVGIGIGLSIVWLVRTKLAERSRSRRTS